MAQGEMHASLKQKYTSLSSETLRFVLLWVPSTAHNQSTHRQTPDYKPGNVGSIFLVQFSDWAWCRLLEDFNCNI